MEDGGNLCSGAFRILGSQEVQQLTVRAGERFKPAPALSKTP